MEGSQKTFSYRLAGWTSIVILLLITILLISSFLETHIPWYVIESMHALAFLCALYIQVAFMRLYWYRLRLNMLGNFMVIGIIVESFYYLIDITQIFTGLGFLTFNPEIKVSIIKVLNTIQLPQKYISGLCCLMNGVLLVIYMKAMRIPFLIFAIYDFTLFVFSLIFANEIAIKLLFISGHIYFAWFFFNLDKLLSRYNVQINTDSDNDSSRLIDQI